MIGLLITVWLVMTGLYYLVICVLRLALTLPAAVVFIVSLPAMPFIVAYRNRTEHPVQAKVLCWLCGVLYAIFIATCFIG